MCVADPQPDDTPEPLTSEFFAELAAVDDAIAARVAAEGCPSCGGPLHRGDYARKPRGGWLAAEGEAPAIRRSLCCGRPGCRKRALPPSVRFLGRRVYWEAVVLLASIRALVSGVGKQVVQATGVPRRTLKRWRAWWQDDFAASPFWMALRARFQPPPPDETTLPVSLCERLAVDRGRGEKPAAVGVLTAAARLLAPVTTRSVPDSARFMSRAAPS
jgi:hypothetical protein